MFTLEVFRMAELLELVGKDRDGRALYSAPGVTTYRDRGMPLEAADAAVFARSLVRDGGGARLLIVNRSTARAARFTFGATLLHSVSGEVRLYGVTGVLVHSGFARKARDGWSATVSAGGQSLRHAVPTLLAHILELNDSDAAALDATAVEL